MRTGEVEAGLTRLGDGPAYLPELIAERVAEHAAPPADAPGRDRLAADVAALTARLEDERDRSRLPGRRTRAARPCRTGQAGARQLPVAGVNRYAVDTHRSASRWVAERPQLVM